MTISSCLMLVTAPVMGLTSVVEKAVSGGVDIVQVRDKGASQASLEVLSWEIAEVVDGRASIVVNNSVAVARRCRAYGVHFPESAQAEHYNEAREAGLSIGASVHSAEAARRAQGLGANYLVAGAVFATTSHPDLQASGLRFLELICRAVDLPVLAIGGVSVRNARECLSAGALGVAVLSSILQADDPRAAAAAYRRALDVTEGRS